MSEREDGSRTEPRQARRWPFLLAGLAALAVAVIRTWLGGAGDLAILAEALSGNPVVAVVYINWYALSAVFFALAVGLLAAPLLTRGAARAVAVIAATAFGATALLFMGFTWAETGSPFTYFPWLPLSATALLSAVAAWRG